MISYDILLFNRNEYYIFYFILINVILSYLLRMSIIFNDILLYSMISSYITFCDYTYDNEWGMYDWCIGYYNEWDMYNWWIGYYDFIINYLCLYIQSIGILITIFVIIYIFIPISLSCIYIFLYGYDYYTT